MNETGPRESNCTLAASFDFFIVPFFSITVALAISGSINASTNRPRADLILATPQLFNGGAAVNVRGSLQLWKSRCTATNHCAVGVQLSTLGLGFLTEQGSSVSSGYQACPQSSLSTLSNTFFPKPHLNPPGHDPPVRRLNIQTSPIPINGYLLLSWSG